MRPYVYQRGLTLIELMIGLVIGLLITAMVGFLFLNTSRNYRQDERFSALNDETRLAVGELTSDLEMAGFWGTMIDPSLIDRSVAGDPAADSLGSVVDCGANRFLLFTEAVSGVNAAAGSAINAEYPCIAAAEVFAGPGGAGTAALKVNHVSGTWISRTDLDARRLANNEAPRVFLQTLSTSGGMLVSPADPKSPVVGPLDTQCTAAGDICRYWEMRSSIYYVRNFTVDGDGIPCLTRKRLQTHSGAVRPVSECLVSGVEDFHVEYGLDTTGDAVVDSFTDAPLAADFANVVALRMHVLVRSPLPDGAYQNEKTYRLGNKTVTPQQDGYYRRVGSLAVPLRNVVAQRIFQ